MNVEAGARSKVVGAFISFEMKCNMASSIWITPLGGTWFLPPSSHFIPDNSSWIPFSHFDSRFILTLPKIHK